MIEETIQAMIVAAIAAAPILYLFLRRWASRHAEAKRQERLRDAERPAAPDTSREPSEPRPIFDRLWQRRTEDPAGPKREQSLSGWTPIYSPSAATAATPTGETRAAAEPQQARSPSAAPWPQSASPAVSGASSDSGRSTTGPMDGSPSSPLGNSARSSGPASSAWRRVERMSPLRRAIALSEILGPPVGLSGGRIDR